MAGAQFVNGVLTRPCKICGCSITPENAVFAGNNLRLICNSCDLIRRREDNKNRYNKNRMHKYRLKTLFGLSIDDYTKLLQQQNGVCAICKQINKDGKVLCVDHNHETGKNRGLLCTSCNLLLSKCKEDKNILMDAINYLIKYDTEMDVEKEQKS